MEKFKTNQNEDVKTSKNETLKVQTQRRRFPLVIYNSIIPFKGFMAMMTIFILWIRKEYKNHPALDDSFYRHETIHAYQQTEIWLTSIILMIAGCWLLNVSWWWLLGTPVIPFIVYVLCWLIEIALPPYDKAYKNICFETEAIYNEANPNYLKKRKLFQFRFLKYISNKRYPALTAYERRRRNQAFKQ